MIPFTLLVLVVISVCVGLLLFVFFKTNTGLMLRATGDNETMVKSSSINVDTMKFLGMALSNGLVALSGALLAQYQNFADVTGGTGMDGIRVGWYHYRRSDSAQKDDWFWIGQCHCRGLYL